MRNIILWFIERPTIVNLIMIAIVLGGLVSIQVTPKESYPEISTDVITIQSIFLGASPKEVEQGVLVRIEEALKRVSGVKKVLSEAKEGTGTVSVYIREGQDKQKVLQKVKDAVASISSFPKGMLRPQISIMTYVTPVMDLALYGTLSSNQLQKMADSIKEHMLDKKVSSRISIQGKYPREISIEVDTANLKKYNLTFTHLSQVLQSTNLDLSGGTLHAKKEDIRIRFYNKRYTADKIGAIVVKSLSGGHQIRIRDIARIKDGFAYTPNRLFFDGKPALMLTVSGRKGENVLPIAKRVKSLIKTLKLPKGAKLSIFHDHTIELKDRLVLLTENGVQGLILVLVVLAFFMNIRLSFWVAVGLLISILGSFIAGSFLGLTINMMSLFGLMLVLGILVDDAIVIAENIYSHVESGVPAKEAALKGTLEVLPAVTAAVSTTFLTFLPLFFMGGAIGKFVIAVPAMVVIALILSLFEAVFLLPPHLAHSFSSRANLEQRQSKFRVLFQAAFDFFKSKLYVPALLSSLKYRWITLALSISILFLSIGLIGGGFIQFVFFPKIEGDKVIFRLMMKPGTPLKKTNEMSLRGERAASLMSKELHTKYKQHVLVHTLRRVGSQVSYSSSGFSGPTGEEVAEIQLKLISTQKRKVPLKEIIASWKKHMGKIPGSTQVAFVIDEYSVVGKPLEFQVLGSDYKKLLSVASLLKKRLSQYRGVYNPEDDRSIGKKELVLSLTPLAHSLGLSTHQIGSQIRSGVYGREVMRLQVKSDEYRVMLRYPSHQRSSVTQFKNMWIDAGNGQRMPLSQLVTWREERGLKVVRRIKNKRVITVFAQLDESTGNKADILKSMQKKVFPEIKKMAPSIRIALGGQSSEEGESFKKMMIVFPMALFGIFFILVLAFNSYVQVLLIMSMIPFGIIGAALAHWLFSMPLTFLSFFGIVGTSGVVVNGSIVLIDAINRTYSETNDLYASVVHASQSRFRPIVSTTLTTVVGLLPLLFETSSQAQVLIPMTLSLVGGVAFSTLLTLFLLPSLVLLLDDFKKAVRWLWNGPEAE